MIARPIRRRAWRHVVTQAACALALCGNARGLGTFFGREESEWAEGKAAVVLAIVRDVKEAPEAGDFTATFLPRSTLAGNFDCGLHPRVRMRFFASVMGGTSINYAPREGDLVMAVIGSQTKGEDYYVYAVFCAFMPNSEGMVTVRGVDDPKVIETLKEIQTARLKGDPATRPAATQPASDPGK